MTGSEEQQKLSKDVAAVVVEAVYGYGELSEERLLKASDVLAPFYPLSEDEDAAAITLREWRTARQVENDATGPLKSLTALAECGVREWSNMVGGWYREWEHRRERRYREERHPEIHHELLHKELYHGLQSRDPVALLAAVERIVEESLLRGGPLPVGPPPQVQVTKEIGDLAREMAETTRKQLSGYVKRVAAAKQVLTRYVHRIVAAEGITRQKS